MTSQSAASGYEVVFRDYPLEVQRVLATDTSRSSIRVLRGCY